MSEKIYEMITDRMLEAIENGNAPWQKPWVGDVQPSNFKSKKPYRGINTFLLLCAPYACPYWLTFKQAKEKGGKIRKGEKGYPVIFWKWIFKKDEDETKKFPLLRYYTVFNLEQTSGIKIPEPEKTGIEFTPIEKAEKIIGGYPNPPAIKEGQAAAYRPSKDLITLPSKDRFKSVEEYYSTLFHELGHSTGSSKRLDRKELSEYARFGSPTYSKEELVAEFTAAFLCGQSGISIAVQENQAAYLRGWSKKLRENKKWLVQAAGKAQKAADHILGIEHQDA